MAGEPPELASERKKPGRQAGGEAGIAALSPRSTRLTGCRSGRRGRVSVHEEEGAPGELTPTSLPPENPAAAERSLSAPAEPIGQRARGVPTAADACGAGGTPLRRQRAEAVIHPWGSRFPRWRGHLLVTLCVSSPLLERRASAWLGFSSLLVVPDRGADQTKVRVD